MQAVRGSSERVEWRSKSHLNLWLGHSRNPQALTRKAPWQRCLSLPVVTNAVRGLDFACQIRHGPGATSAAAHGNSRAVTSSFSPSRRVAGHGFGHFFALISAGASALSSRGARDATIYPVFRALCSLTTSSSTGQKVIVGTGFAANISCRDESLNGRRSSCWPEIRVIVLFLFSYS